MKGSRMFDGRVVVITGGSRGIGRACASLFAARGARVAVAARNIEDCREVAASIRSTGASAQAFHVDISSEATVAALYRDVAAEFGGIDICINNAGAVLPGDAAPLATALSTWVQSLELNLTGTFVSLQHQLPWLIARGGGAIVNVSGTAALLGSATPQISYDAAKAGILSLTRDVALVHAVDGIRCNCVCPGPVDGEMMTGIVADSAVKRDRLNHIPAGRFGTAAEIAESIAYLASPLAGWTTGVTLPIDGGITAAYNTHAHRTGG